MKQFAGRVAAYKGCDSGQNNKTRKTVQTFSDETVSFDGGESVTIPGKSAIDSIVSHRLMAMLNQMGVKTHFQKPISTCEHVVFPCEPLPFKLVIRSHALGSFALSLGLKPGTLLPEPIIEFRYEQKPTQSVSVSEQIIAAFGWADEQEVDEMLVTANRVNDVLKGFFACADFTLAELHLRFGRCYTPAENGDIETEKPLLMIVGQLSADTCRLLDQLQGGAPAGKDAVLDTKSLENYRVVAERIGLTPSSDFTVKQQEAQRNTRNNHKTEVMDAALHGLSANKIGVNGRDHGADNHLAWVEEGDMVIPPHALTPALVNKLKHALGEQWTTHLIGQGREIELSEFITSEENAKPEKR